MAVLLSILFLFVFTFVSVNGEEASVVPEGRVLNRRPQHYGASPRGPSAMPLSLEQAGSWRNGKPASVRRRSTAPTPRVKTTTPQQCRCSKIQLCNDIHYDRSITSSHECPVKGEVCCNRLQTADAYSDEMSDNDLSSGTSQSEDASIYGSAYGDNGHLDLSAEDVGGGASSWSPTRFRTSTEESAESYDLEAYEGTKSPVVEYQCGVATPELIVDHKFNTFDTNAKFGQFPWTLLILQNLNGRRKVVCGAALIDQYIAVTAAHCVAGKNAVNLTVRAGEWDILSEEEQYPHQDTLVKTVVVHENYTMAGAHHDIALLVLLEPIKLAPHIGKICVLRKNDSISSGGPCFATGWGMRGNVVSPSEQSKMKRVELTFVKPAVCENKLRATSLGPRFFLSNTAFCASRVKGDEDTSLGDGGGPLFCKTKKGPYVLVGIVSWGKTGYADAPGVYTSVKKYRSWIDEQTIDAYM